MRYPMRGRASPRRRGAAATEFALVLPLMALIALGCVDFGRFAYQYIAVHNAARAGASYAIMNPFLAKGKATWDLAVQQQARDEMTNQTGYDANQLVTTTTTTLEKSGLRRVKVHATYPFATIVSWPGIPSSVDLAAAVEMRVIR